MDADDRFATPVESVVDVAENDDGTLSLELKEIRLRSRTAAVIVPAREWSTAPLSPSDVS